MAADPACALKCSMPFGEFVAHREGGLLVDRERDRLQVLRRVMSKPAPLRSPSPWLSTHFLDACDALVVGVG